MACTTWTISPLRLTKSFPSTVLSAKSLAGPRYSGSVAKCFVSLCTRGVKSSAPDPNPAMVMPEAVPFLSGNHWKHHRQTERQRAKER